MKRIGIKLLLFTLLMYFAGIAFQVDPLLAEDTMNNNLSSGNGEPHTLAASLLPTAQLSFGGTAITKYRTYLYTEDNCPTITLFGYYSYYSVRLENQNIDPSDTKPETGTRYFKVPLQEGLNRLNVKGLFDSYDIYAVHVPPTANEKIRSEIEQVVTDLNNKVPAGGYTPFDAEKEINRQMSRVYQDFHNYLDIYSIVTTEFDANRKFLIGSTEDNTMDIGITAKDSAKVLQDSVEVKSFSSDYQRITFNLHNGINNLEVQFGEGESLAVYKICVIHIPRDADETFLRNIFEATAGTYLQTFDENSYILKIKEIIQGNKYIAFTNFTHDMDMNRKYRILYTAESQLAIKCSTPERAEISMVKMSNSSNVDGTESYLVNGTTGYVTVPLVQGRNELKISFTELGEVTTYYYAIFRESSTFGNNTKNEIINAVISADSALNNDYQTYQAKLNEVSRTYFDKLNSWWTRWR
ncbi:MAG: hypothetical protein ABFD08_09860 [Syntrophomonas sp.]